MFMEHKEQGDSLVDQLVFVNRQFYGDSVVHLHICRYLSLYESMSFSDYKCIEFYSLDKSRSVFTDHSQEHCLSFSPRFGTLERITTSD